jgi:hypothetical protein
MSNSLRGAVPFECDGQTMHLRVTTNAMVRYQDVAGETFLTGLAALEKDPSDIRRIRRMVWAAMSHADISEDRAGEVMDEVGLLDIVGLLSEAAAAAFPQAKPGNVKSGTKRPRNQTT